MSEIHFIGGEKGGVGKSIVARLLAQYFIDREIKWQGFDGDLSHGALMRYYSDFASPLDLDRLEAMDSLIESTAELEDAKVLVDLAAQSEQRLHAWIEEAAIAELCSELGIGLVFWHVMDDGKDSVTLLQRLLSRYGDSVRYVIVQNALRGDKFDLFEQSEAHAAARELGTPVMSLRALHHPIMKKIDQLDQSFWAASNNPGWADKGLGLMERQRVKVWMRNAYDEFDRLGLASD
jgi:hypothetical protein